MLELTGERFSLAMLERAQLRSKYLDEQGASVTSRCTPSAALSSSSPPFAGNPLRLELIPRQSIEAALAVYTTMTASEIAGATSFIRACLKFEPSDRASAKELELHPWLTGSSCA